MGDSAACLMRSFSHPSNSIRESQEGDPLRALTESISFGRFASESLAWEKWSAFSHNRYLEEVEQFSKPGSVAAKKAFFEAHYKKRAAMKKAALLEQQVSTEPADVANSDSNPDTVSSVEAQQQQTLILKIDGSPRLETIVDNVDELMGEGTPIKESMDVQSNKRRKSSASSAGRSSKTTSGMSKSAAADKQTATVVSLKLEMDYSPNIERVATESEVGIDEKMHVDNVGDTIREGTPIKESMDLQSNKRRKSSASSTARNSKTTTTKTSGMSKSASADKQTVIAVSPKLEMDYSPNLETVVTESEVDITTPTKESMDLQRNKRRKSSASSAGRTKTTTSTSMSKSAATKQTAATSSSRTKVGTEKKVAEDTPVYRKRLAPKAVHMSINFASRLWETGKSSLRKSKEHGTGLKSAAVTKGSVQGELKIRASVAAIKASVHGKSEIRSSMAVTKIRASVATATKASVQGELKICASMAAGQAHDKSNTKSSGMSGSKARPPLMLSPFSFRSEERAARRKEIMEERNKAKEAESLQMQAKAKEKAKIHSNILRQSTATSRTRPDDDSSCRPQSVANHTRKSQVPLTRPRSPKLGRKPAASSSANMEANKCRSSVRASVNITENSNSSKRVVPKKSIQSTNRSSTSLLPKRKTQENASPNIQL